MRCTRRFARLLLVFFLMAGLPLRGYAMGMLAPQMARAAQAALMDELATHEQGMDGHVMHEHAMQMHRSQAHAHLAAPVQGMPQHHGGPACGPCADCCTAGTLQSLPLAVRPPLAPHRVDASPAPAPASFIADLLVPPPDPLAA